MKIRYASDLHLDSAFFKTANSTHPKTIEKNFNYYMDMIPEQPDDKDTVLVLAGDIIQLSTAMKEKTDFFFKTWMEQLSNRFKHVFWIMGNHEFYDGGLYSVTHHAEELVEGLNVTVAGENVKTYRIDEVTFLLATLWTDMGGENNYINRAIERGMNDFNYIKDDMYSAIKVKNVQDIFYHTISDVSYHLDFIQEKVVVVTHHAPSVQSINVTRYGMFDSINRAYYTDLEDMIAEYPMITHWIHGHTHYPVTYKLHDTIVTSNPHGYLNEYVDYNPIAFVTV